MTATEPPHPGPREATEHDDDSLTELGYRPELKRTLGNFHTFAAGISYISILTGTFQLFYFGVTHGGPAEPPLGCGHWTRGTHDMARDFP